MKWERLGRKVALDVALGLNYLHSQVRGGCDKLTHSLTQSLTAQPPGFRSSQTWPVSQLLKTPHNAPSLSPSKPRSAPP